jgi:hypothetical protein
VKQLRTRRQYRHGTERGIAHYESLTKTRRNIAVMCRDVCICGLLRSISRSPGQRVARVRGRLAMLEPLVSKAGHGGTPFSTIGNSSRVLAVCAQRSKSPEIFSAIHSEKSLAHFILVACSATLFNQSVGGCGRARVKDARPRLRRPAGPARLSWPEFESACQVLDHHCVRPSTRSRQSAAIMPAGPAATWRSLRSLVEGHLCLSRR